MIFLIFGIGPNFLLAFCAISVLLIGGALLWRDGEPPVLFFIFGSQWLQAAMVAFYGNWLDETIDHFTFAGGNTALAVMLCLVGLLFLAVGMRLGAGRFKVGIVKQAQITALRISKSTWLFIYVMAMLISGGARVFAGIVPGLSQPLLAVADLKWAAFFMLTYATFLRQSSRLLWLLAFSIEFLMSFGGYFSSFKFVFIFSVIGLLSAKVRLSSRQVIIALAMGVCLIALGIVWTAVKVDYRTFVNGGTRSQAITTDYDRSVGELLNLATTLTPEDLRRATDRLVERIAYVDYFGMVLNYVPNIVPYQDGELWLDAITRPLFPRFLFPNKEAIDESAMTREYTGLDIAGAKEGTSISIGYMGESYVDFGEIGMMLPIFALGFALGRIYRWLNTSSGARGIFGMGLSAAVLITNASYLESSTAKVIGGLAVSTLVVWVLSRTFAISSIGQAGNGRNAFLRRTDGAT